MATDGEYERLRDFVAAADPLLVEAVDDVDVELLHWALTLSPWQRVQTTTESLRFLAGFRRGASEAR